MCSYKAAELPYDLPKQGMRLDAKRVVDNTQHYSRRTQSH